MKSRLTILVLILLFFSLRTNAQADDMVVAKDGSGDYTSIQEAIDAVPSNSSARTVIHIKSGLYDMEKLIVPSDKQNVSLIGESRTETIISYHMYDCLDGHCPVEDAALWSDEIMQTSATLTIKGDGFRAENLTLQNTAGPVGQAQAITVRGDKAVFINCDLKSYQDTIYFWNEGKRAYFEGCLIVGRTDYIYGGGIDFFQDCEIRSWGGGLITAPSTPQNQEYGFVFNGCTLSYATGSPRSGDDGRSVALGRPWHNYPKVTWEYCNMTGKIDPLGWPTTWNMSYAATSADLELHEYKNTGDGADMSGRANWAGIRGLTDAEAPRYTRQAVLAGTDGWDPVTTDESGEQGYATLTKHGAGSSRQTVNVGESIADFYYTWTNASSVTVTGLPQGVNASIDIVAQTITISGSPSEAGTFMLTVTTVGGTTDASHSGTIMVTDALSENDGDISITDTAPGWASLNGGTTGGGTDMANAVSVSSMSALQSEASGSGSRIILVQPGTYDGTLAIGANKTIIGTGPGITIRGNVKISGTDSTNVILRNFAVRGLTCGSYDECRAGADAVYIGNGAHNVWVDHLDVADGQDGNLDITRAADYVTVSWTKFHYTYDKEHRFSNLIAGGDDETQSQGELKITYMDCWWGDWVDSRQPRGRFGNVHMLNNYHHTGGGQIHGVGYDMALIAENCYYDEPGRSIFTDMGSPRGWRGIGNAGSASNMSDSRGSVFIIPYNYSAMPASEVKAVVTAESCGAGNTCQFAQ